MDNHTEVPDRSRFDDGYRRLRVIRKEIAMRLSELHAEGVPSMDDIFKAHKVALASERYMVALREARDDAISCDEAYQRLLREQKIINTELDKLGDEILSANDVKIAEIPWWEERRNG